MAYRNRSDEDLRNMQRAHEIYADGLARGLDLERILIMVWLDGDAHGRLKNRLGGSTLRAEKPKKRKAVHLAAGKEEWRRLRYRALQAAQGKCQCCGATAQSSGHPLHVDHIKPKSKFPELALEFSNLQVLCKDCNFGKCAWDQTDWRTVLLDIA